MSTTCTYSCPLDNVHPVSVCCRVRSPSNTGSSRYLEGDTGSERKTQGGRERGRERERERERESQGEKERDGEGVRECLRSSLVAGSG